MANVRAAEAVVPCVELEPTLTFFTERLGFRLDAIFPADDPAVAVISGHGLRLRLERGPGGAPGALRLACQDPAALAGGAQALVAPNGMRIELVRADAPPALPPLQPAFVLTRMSPESGWLEGRAGMRYHDLVPERLGGHLVASHIRIEQGGPVSDYVHFHEVRFQMIYCWRGWVRVVYEDQGPPFVLASGDCVLQPPRIRHRVLASSPGCEVIELSAPAEHETRVDHELVLPTPLVRRERDFTGQRFVRHERASAAWRPWRVDGFEARDLGIAAATRGIASACVARVAGARRRELHQQEPELRFVFVLQGAATLECDGRHAEPLGAGDALVLPSGSGHGFVRCSPDLELLEVAMGPQGSGTA